MPRNAGSLIAIVVVALGLACTSRSALAQVGACCDSCQGGSCQLLTAAECMAIGGQFQGPGTSCAVVVCAPFGPCPPDCIKPGAGVGISAFTGGQIIGPGQCAIPGLGLNYLVRVFVPTSPPGLCNTVGGQLAIILPNWQTFNNPKNIEDFIEVAGYPGLPDIPLMSAVPFIPFDVVAPVTYIADPADAAFGLLNVHVDYGQTGFLMFNGITQESGLGLSDPEQEVNAATAITTPLCIPDIDIVKTASPSIVCQGQPTPVTYTYMVSNPSNVDLQIVSLVDNQPACGTLCAIPPDDDCLPMMGDSNGDGLLNPGEIWIYQCVTNISQTTTNIATVTAFGVAFNGEVVETHTYTAMDDAVVTAVGTPACQITGPPLVCPAASNVIYTVTETTGIPGATFSWSISGDGSFCPGTPTTGPSVCVNAGAVCPGGFTLTVTVTAGLCTNTCSLPVMIDDTVPPVITCPPNAVFECDERINAGMATATDNCPIAPVITASDMSQRGDCPQEMVITRTWTATDFCGNESSCQQTITVVDTTPPVITCPPGFNVQCLEDVPPCNPANATATDNCDPTVLITCTSGPLVGGPCGGTVTRTYTATDDCGNQSSCQQVITVDDTLPPVITCPPGFSVQCIDDVPPCNPANATASDNCDDFVMIACSQGPLVGGACGGTITRTYTATDDCGNQSSCQQVITVDDTIPPMITCPAGFSVQCPEDVPACNPANASATDNCDDDVLITCSQGPLVGGPCGGTVTRTYTATDDCGNTASCMQVITVDDTIPPVITCPPPFSVQCPEDVPACNPASATASDNCDDTVMITCSQGPLVGGPCGGTVTRTYTATDDCGNTASCMQVITVDDTIPPVITCPPNFSVQCPEDVPACNPASATATDNCDDMVMITCSQGPLVGGPCGGTVTRTYTATDDCGNTASCMQVITVDDTIPPVITCPPPFSVQCPEDVPACNPASASATDNCDDMVMITCSQGPLVGGPCGGTVTRTYTATDDCGNQSSCMQVITVDDTIPPVITCPPPFSVQCPEDVPACNPASASATDNCDDMVMITCSQGPLVGGPCGGTVTRTYTATDDCGNTASCQQVITVDDTIPPVITCPPPFSVQCPEDVPACNPASATATDNCDDMVMITCSQGPLVGGPCGGTVTRTYTATDDCGNTASCQQVITVDDTIPPVITCPTGFSVQCPEDVPSCNPADATATDNCDDTVMITCSQGPLVGGPCGGTVTRTYTATDDCGNTASCQQVITVDDTIPPVITCPPPFSVQCTDDVPSCNPASASATDNCDDMVMITCSQGPLVGGPCGGTVTRTYTATDDCGNTASCQQVITVDDTIPPVITCPPNSSVQCPEDVLACNPADATATDNCDDNVMITCSQGPLVGGPCGGTVTRTYTATDDCGNTASCMQVITVDDTQRPTITCLPDQTVLCDTPTTLVVSATDNCTDPGDLSFSCTAAFSPPGSGTFMDNGDGTFTILFTATGTATITCTATDLCGNTSTSCSFMAFAQCCDAVIGDFVWLDEDRDGCQDPGEPGIPGVTVTLLRNCGNPVLPATTVTDAFGFYQFTGLCAGQYLVRFQAPPGLIETIPNAGCGANSDALDSDCMGGQVCVTVDDDDVLLTIDCGFQCTGIIGDRVWRDNNGNGCQDPGEPGLAAVTVNLFSECNQIELIDTTVTNAMGIYQFDGLCAGSYLVQFVPPAGFVETTPDATCGGPGGSDANDSDCLNGVVCVTLAGNGQVNNTIDCGLQCTGVIGDFIWFDENGDGCQDSTETGLGGLTVTLFTSCTAPQMVASTVTDSSGFYQFDNLCPADYRIVVQNAPDLVPSPPNQPCEGPDPADELDSDCVDGAICQTLALNETDLSNDCGFREPPTCCDPNIPDDGGMGQCDEPHDFPCCRVERCCELVCPIDPTCCQIAWDETCVEIALDVCLPDPPICPGEGSCNQPHDTPGCDDLACCSLICFIDFYCCTVEWTEECADTADKFCGNPAPAEGPARGRRGSWFAGESWDGADVPGPDSDVIIEGTIIVDQGGAAARDVRVEKGGTLSLPGGGLTARTLTVTGGGTLALTHEQARLTVDTLTLEPGAFLLWTAGVIEVAGGSLRSADSDLVVGTVETLATLRLLSGAEARLGRDLYVGLAPHSRGSVEIDGPRTRLEVGSAVVVGFEGEGTLVLSGGAAMTCHEGRIGARPEGSGSVLVSGSSWTCLSTLTVGASGQGSLSLAGSAEVTAARIEIGAGGVVSGEGVLRGSVHNAGRLDSSIGLRIEGSLVQTNGGVLVLPLGPEGKLAASGRVRLDGTLSLTVPAGAAPQAGEEILLLEADAIEGSFTEVLVPEAMAGRVDIRYQAGRVVASIRP